MPAATRSTQQLVEAELRAGCSIARGNAPTPGTTRPAAARSAPWSALTSALTPTCSSAFSTERRLPIP